MVTRPITNIPCLEFESRAGYYHLCHVYRYFCSLFSTFPLLELSFSFILSIFSPFFTFLHLIINFQDEIMRIYAYKGGILLENKGSRLFLTPEGKGELITGYYSHFSFNLKDFRANSGCFPQRRGVPLPGTAFHRGNGLHFGCDPSYRSWPVPKTKSRLFSFNF